MQLYCTGVEGGSDVPFSDPWRDYQYGDILFGLADERHQLAEHVGIVDDDTVYTIDQYDIADVAASGNNGLNGPGLKYDRNFIDALKRHPKHRNIVDKKIIFDAGDPEYREDILVYKHPIFPLYPFPVKPAEIAKQKCKAGLDYFIRRTENHVHFCLDGIDMLSVPKKNYLNEDVFDYPIGKSTDKSDVKVRSITGSELRWVFRNRLDHRVQARVQFWQNNIQVVPPWHPPHPVAWRRAWAAYIPEKW